MQREYFHTGNDFKLHPILRLFISTCPCHIFLIKSIYILISFFLTDALSIYSTTVHEAEFVTQLLYAELQPVVEVAKG